MSKTHRHLSVQDHQDPLGSLEDQEPLEDPQYLEHPLHLFNVDEFKCIFFHTGFLHMSRIQSNVTVLKVTVTQGLFPLSKKKQARFLQKTKKTKPYSHTELIINQYFQA